MSTLNLDSEKQAKLKELENQLKAAQDRLALIAEKYLDGDLSKEEKMQLSMDLILIPSILVKMEII